MANNVVTEMFRPSIFRAFDETTGLQVWTRLGIIGVDALPDSSVAENPISLRQYVDQQLFDESAARDSRNAKIITPTRIQIRAISDNEETISSILSYFADIESTLTIYTKEIIANSMCIVDVDIEQSSERLDAMMIKIVMKQTEESYDTTFDPSNPADSSTFGIRIQRLEGSTMDNIAEGIAARARSATTSFTSSVSNLYNRVKSQIGI